MSHLIRSISGIRGIVGSTFTKDLLKQHIHAFLCLQEKGQILVAYDGRSHGKEFLEHAAMVIKDAGWDAVNCGLIPTPTAQFLIKKHEFSGGVIITASHNPSEWNGMKFIDADACFTSPEKTLKLLKNADDEISPEISGTGKIKDGSNLWLDHVRHTLELSALNLERIKRKSFKVVVDAVNCTGSVILPELLEKLGCKVYTLNCNSTGEFSRGAEPLPENLDALCRTVIEKGADLGFATDPDGDRLAVVNDKGQPLGEEFTLPFCMDGFYTESNTTSPVVVNLSTSMLNDWVCQKHGVQIQRSKVGEINVVEKMKEVDSEIGGEGNGGVIYADSHYGRDAIVAAALFLNRLSMENLSLTKVRSTFPDYRMIKDKINIAGLDIPDVIKRIKDNYHLVKSNELDGLKLIWNDKWIHIRPSNTEPILRIYGEAEDEHLLMKELDTIKQLIS